MRRVGENRRLAAVSDTRYGVLTEIEALGLDLIEVRQDNRE